MTTMRSCDMNTIGGTEYPWSAAAWTQTGGHSKLIFTFSHAIYV